MWQDGRGACCGPDLVVAYQIVTQVDDMVVVMDEGLRAEACGVATQLRGRGRRVDLVLQAKKMKWVFKQAERCDPSNMNSHDPRSQLRLQPYHCCTATCDTPLCICCRCPPRCIAHQQ
jgi:hypothetical protein